MRAITANVSCKGLFCIQEIEEYTDLLFAFYSFSFKNTSLPHNISCNSTKCNVEIAILCSKKEF